MRDVTAVTLREFYEGYYRPEKHPLPGQVRTRQSFRTEINNFLRHNNRQSIVIGDLSDQLLKGAMSAAVECGGSPASANTMYRSIKAIWRYAVNELDLGIRLPKTKQFKEIKKQLKCWSTEEFAAIISAARNKTGMVGKTKANVFWPALLLLTYSTGARINAIMQTPSENLDMTGGTILIPGESQKHGADQDLDLHRSTLIALAWLDPMQRRLPTIFADWPYDGGQKWEWRSLTRHYRKLIIEAGLAESMEDVTCKDLWHKIRRSLATHYYTTAGMEQVQSRLGHSAASVTRGYIDSRYIKRPRVRDVVPDPDPAYRSSPKPEPEPPAIAPALELPAVTEPVRLSLYNPAS